MSGGIFVDRPFHPNIKCVIIAAVICAGYWYLPATRNPLILIFLFAVTYVAIAVYDYLYVCRDKLYSGYFPGMNTLDSIFKPDATGTETVGGASQEDKAHGILQNQEAAFLQHVYLFHVLIVAPLLLYVGVSGPCANKYVWQLFIGLGSVALVYHGYRLLHPRVATVA